MRSSRAVAPGVFGDRVIFTVPAIAASTVSLPLGDSHMSVFRRSTFATAVVLAVLAPSAARAQTTFDRFDEFLAAVGASGVDSYDDLTAFSAFDSPISRLAGGFAYTVASDAPEEDLFFSLENPDVAGDIWLSTEDALASLRFDDFGPRVRAVGGRFFTTDLLGSFSGTDVIVIAEDMANNIVQRTLSPLGTGAFFGVLFDNPILSLRIVAVNELPTDAFFATANDLVLAEALASAVPVPEPSTLLLLAVPMLLLARRRRPGA